MGLFQSIFQKSGERFPKSQYLTFIINRDDVQTPIVGSLDVAYRDYPFQAEVPWLINLTVRVQEDNDSEYPTPEEQKAINLFEDILSEKFRSLARTHWVGRLTYDNVRDLMWHIDNPEPIHTYLQEIIDREDHPCTFEYEILKNPKWETFCAILSDVDKKGTIVDCAEINKNNE